MKKHRVFLLTLGLLAMMGLMAGQARAETMTLTVYAGSGTSGAVLASFLGTANTVSADIGAVNAALSGGGFGAYTFSSLGGDSNSPGANNPIGGILQAHGDLTVHPGTGASTPITVVVSEDGFTAPSGVPAGHLADLSTADYAGVAAGGTQDSTGMYAAPSASPTVLASTTPGALTAIGGPLDVHSSTSATGFNPFLIPYTLTSVTVLNIDPATAAGGSVGFTNKVFVTSTIPEPASVVMMLTGMPLPLVVLGLLRRRRAAA